MKIPNTQSTYTGARSCPVCGRSDKITRIDDTYLKCDICGEIWRSYKNR